MENTTINVKWDHDEIEYTGTMSFENTDNNQVHISAEDDRQHQVFENGDVDVETAEAVSYTHLDVYKRQRLWYC